MRHFTTAITEPIWVLQTPSFLLNTSIDASSISSYKFIGCSIALIHSVFNYSLQWLRYPLTQQYGDRIQFHTSLRSGTSDLVSRRAPELASLIDDQHIIELPSQSASSETFASNSQSSGSPIRPLHTACSPEVELIHTGLFVRNLVAGIPAKIPHSPSASDLTVKKAMESVPPALYYLISTIGSKSADVPLDVHSYSNDDPVKTKVLSICQAILSLQGKTTPKAVALGTTLRHVSSSKYIVNLLNGLGHTPSYDTVLRVETALAYQQRRNQQA